MDKKIDCMNDFLHDLQELGITLSQEQINQFIMYYDLLTEWNSCMNLTAITEYQEVLKKHFIDSLFIVTCYQFNKEEKIIDIGTGAGFPGIPLKIVYPHLRITLMDSLQKKINFLNEVILKLQLKNITAIHSRAEDLSNRKEYREQYNLCVSRAVANLSTLSEYCLPFVKVGGFFISYKSEKAKEELDAAKKAIFLLGGKVKKQEEGLLPASDIKRNFIMIEKIQNTSAKYPRKAGMPSKDPLH